MRIADSFTPEQLKTMHPYCRERIRLMDRHPLIFPTLIRKHRPKGADR